MDVRKSYKADLENQRSFSFLLGLVVVLALFVVALEFTTRAGLPETSDDVLDDISQDVEMMPVVSHDAIAAVSAGRKVSGQTDKIAVVDKAAPTLADNSREGKDDVLSRLSGMGIGGVTAIQDTPIPAMQANPVDMRDKPLDFQVVERLPEYPGGMSAFVQWLTKNLRYPITAQRRKVQGTVLVAFIINKDGSITDLKVIKSASAELDREALRVLRMMPAARISVYLWCLSCNSKTCTKEK